MVVDVAESLVEDSSTGSATTLTDGMPPTYPYLARATSWLMNSGTLLEDTDWQLAAEEVLQMSLDKYSSRWFMSGDQTCRKEDREGQNSPL